MSTQFLDRPDGQRIAYRALPARHGLDARPGVVFLGGFNSAMSGIKGSALQAHCEARGLSYLRFDYFGHGESSGAFVDGTISRWKDDAVAVLDQLTRGPQVLIGSSMGAWVMLLAALARRDQVAALLGIAAAADFTENLIRPALNNEQREALAADGVFQRPSRYGDDPYPISQALLDDGARHLVLRDAIELECPLRLLHSLDDPDVPWQTSQRLLERYRGTDARLALIKDGGHRLSRRQDLALLFAQLDELCGA